MNDFQLSQKTQECMNDEVEKKTENSEPRRVSVSNSTDLLTGVLKKWKSEKDDLYKNHGDCYGHDKTYEAGLLDQLQTCISELDSVINEAS